MKSEALTLVLVNLAGIMERADEALLPGVYKEVGEALHIDPTGLGSLTLFRSLVQSLCYPIAAYLALRHNRAHVIALGAFLCAAATFCVAISSTFFQVPLFLYNFLILSSVLMFKICIYKFSFFNSLLLYINLICASPDPFSMFSWVLVKSERRENEWKYM